MGYGDIFTLGQLGASPEQDMTGIIKAFQAGAALRKMREDHDAEIERLKQTATRMEMERQVEELATKLKLHSLLTGRPKADLAGVKPQSITAPALGLNNQEIPMPQSLEELVQMISEKSKAEAKGQTEGRMLATPEVVTSALTQAAKARGINLPDIPKVATEQQLSDIIRSVGLAAPPDSSITFQQDIPGVAKAGETVSQDEARLRMESLKERGAAARSDKKISTLTPVQELAETRKLAEDYKRFTKGARETVRQFNVMESTMKGINDGTIPDLNAASQAIITTFNKIMDPSSVVRESEYARSPEGQALFDRLQGKAQSLVKGGPGLTPKNLQEFVTLAKTYKDQAVKSVAGESDRIKNVADKYGLDMKLITGGVDMADTNQSSSTRKFIKNPQNPQGAWYVVKNGQWVPE